jgi:spore maturation protein CgeB
VDKKKIAIIGSNHIAALELVYMKLLKKKGFSVSLFPAQNIFFDYYFHSLVNKIFYRLGFSNILNKIQKDLKSFINEFDPNIVIVFKGMEIAPKTLIWLKKREITIYNYNPDHPYIFSGRGSGNLNVTNSISLFDCYFSYSEDVVRQLNDISINSKILPFAFDSDGFTYSEITQCDEILKTCFLGNADNFRVKFLNNLAELGLQIDVYGENWNSFKLNKSININPPKYGQDFWKTLQQYAVQLNLLRPHNFNSHNMRSFDIPGSGGIMLAPFTKDHYKFFKEDIDIFLYDSLEMALHKANQILSLSFEERLVIRKNARNSSLRSHSYAHRVNLLIDSFEKK